MSIFGDSLRKLVEPFAPLIDKLKRRILGANNERIDFLMDSFYKLSPQQQTGVIIGMGASLGVLIVFVFGVYFIRVSALESDLERGFIAIQELRVQASRYKAEKARFDSLLSKVGSKTNNLRPKPFFQKKATSVGISLESLKSENGEIDKDSPLSEHFNEIRVDFRMPKVSIPRMLKFLVEIERSDKTLTIRDLKVRARYGDKLYFDAEAKAVGFKRL